MKFAWPLLDCRIRQWMAATCIAALVACGGGGGSGGGSGASHAPVLSNLHVVPQAVYVSPDPITFTGELDFADAGGDLDAIRLTITASNGSTSSDAILPVQGVAGLRQGTITGAVSAVGVQPDTYTFSIYAQDAAGQTSNVLRAAVRIAAYPWSSRAIAPMAREYAAATTLNGLVYVVGGQRTDSGVVPGPATAALEIYNPATNTWLASTPMPTARMGLVAVTLNGKIYAVGGRTDGFSTSAVGTVEEFDPATNLWRTLNPMPTPRYFAAGAVVNGQIVVVGGESLLSMAGDVELFNPVANSWVRRSSLPTPRSQLSLVEAGGRLYAVGGYGGTLLQWTGRVEAYDPLTDVWTRRADMPTARAMLAMAAFNGQLLAAGGENVNRALDVLESYDPAANAWTTKTPATSAFTRAAAAVVDGRWYAFGNALALQYDPANEIR